MSALLFDLAAYNLTRWVVDVSSVARFATVPSINIRTVFYLDLFTVMIFAAAVIVYALLFGTHQARRVISPGIVRFILAFGVLLYAGVGVAGILLGGNYLDYNVLGHDPVHGQHLGILLIEFGVGATVAAAMISIFLSFAGHDRPLEDD